MLTFSLNLKKLKQIIQMVRKYQDLEMSHLWLMQIKLDLNLSQDRIVKRVSNLLLFLIDIQVVKLNI